MPVPCKTRQWICELSCKTYTFYKDKATYGCHETYALDGPEEVECTKQGNWSARPSCKGMET